MSFPGSRIPSAVEDNQHLDTVCEHDEVDDISKLLQPRGTHTFPNPAMQLRHLLDAGKHFPPRLAYTGGFCGTGAAWSEFRNMPIRNVLGVDLFRQAIPDLLDQIETIAHAQAIDAQ